MKITLISPFHGSSSHAAWARGYQSHSDHQVELETLCDRAWAWRMRGGAVPLSQQLLSTPSECDLLLVTSMTDLSSLMGMLRRSPLASKPCLLYMHENQLTYPIRPGGRRDRHLAFIQFQSMLVADAIWFNSEHNRSSWFSALPDFLKSFPDHQGLELVEGLQQKSQVQPVGLELPDLPERRPGPPLLLWNQRWEWDKNTEAFTRFVRQLSGRVEFDVVLLGGRPQRKPPKLSEFEEFLGARLLHSGWCSREDYLNWLSRATLTVSTARHEFFGISVLEAIAMGVFPLLPDRLSYPEVIPEEFHSLCLYSDHGDLQQRAYEALSQPASLDQHREKLARAARRYAWEKVAPDYDRELETLAGGN